MDNREQEMYGRVAGTHGNSAQQSRGGRGTQKTRRSSGLPVLFGRRNIKCNVNDVTRWKGLSIWARIERGEHRMLSIGLGRRVVAPNDAIGRYGVDGCNTPPTSLKCYCHTIADNNNPPKPLSSLWLQEESTERNSTQERSTKERYTRRIESGCKGSPRL